MPYNRAAPCPVLSEAYLAELRLDSEQRRQRQRTHVGLPGPFERWVTSALKNHPYTAGRVCTESEVLVSLTRETHTVSTHAVF